ncbi:MAG: hypothetical protein PWR07_1730 [Bacillota bacterium]|nr:hypothetical protein [Bacillota bacterium]
MFVVGNIRIAVEVEKNQGYSREARAERVYRDMLTQKHFDQVRTTAIRNAMFTGLR